MIESMVIENCDKCFFLFTYFEIKLLFPKKVLQDLQRLPFS